MNRYEARTCLSEADKRPIDSITYYSMRAIRHYQLQRLLML